MEIEQKLELFRKLFVHRDDVFTVQNAHGDYFKVEKRLNDQIIKDHFRGQHTIGCYQLKQDEGSDTATVKWVCLDIDLHATVYKVPSFRIDEWDEKLDEQVEMAKVQLNQHNLSYYVEDSGQKGRHVWMFFKEPIDAVIAKRAMDMLFKNMPNVEEGSITWEIFPKQTRLQHGYGNLVKLPFGVHQKTKRPSIFHGELDKIDFVSHEQLEATQSPYEAIFHNCEAFRDMRNIALVTNHLNHQQRLALAYVFWNLPNDVYEYDGHQGAKYIEDKIFSKLSDYSPAYIRKEFAYHKTDKTDNDGQVKKAYAPASCHFLQSDSCGNICNGTCSAVGKGKSPITFYYRGLGKETPDVGSFGSKDKLFRPDLYYIDGFKYCQKGENKKDKKESDIIISNFIIKWDKELTYDDGVEKHKVFDGKIFAEEGNGESVKFRIRAEKFSSDKDFRAELYNALGAKIYIENDKKLKEAIYKYTNTEKVNILKIFGFNEDLTAYYTPHTKITQGGVFENTDTIVHLDGEKADALDLAILSNHDFEGLKDHIKTELLNVLEWHVTHTAFAHTMLPIIGAFLEDTLSINRYAFLVRGLSGSGKSHLMTAMQQFYSLKFGPPISWTSTHSSIQRMGYFFKDALFLVDDLKKRNIEKSYSSVLALLQNYADGSTRDRMKADTSMQRAWPIKGWLALTGEDSIEHEASNLARMITVRTTNKVKNLDIGYTMEKWSPVYSAFTARYIHYILNTDKSEIRNTFVHYKNEVFYPMVSGSSNDVRMSQNIAQLMTSYEYTMKFLYEDDILQYDTNIATMLSVLTGLVKKLVKEAGEESPAEIFWSTLLDLLSRKKVFIQEGNMLPTDKPMAGSEMIGFRGVRDNKIYFLTSFFDTIQKYLRQVDRKIGHSKRAVIDELVDKNIIESPKTEVRTINGNSQRVFVATDSSMGIY